MLNIFLSVVNYWAVLVSGAAYWILGAVWFSTLFGKIWSTELERHGVKIQEPTRQRFAAKLIQTFILNLIVAFGVAYIVFAAHCSAFLPALRLGLFTGVCFSAATLGIAYTWEGRSLKLALVDCGYPVAGITLSTIILSVWK